MSKPESCWPFMTIHMSRIVSSPLHMSPQLWRMRWAGGQMPWFGAGSTTSLRKNSSLVGWFTLLLASYVTHLERSQEVVRASRSCQFLIPGIGTYHYDDVSSGTVYRRVAPGDHVRVGVWHVPRLVAQISTCIGGVWPASQEDNRNLLVDSSEHFPRIP